MSDTQLEAQSPTPMLKQDHRSVQDLLSDYAKLGKRAPTEKTRLHQELHEALTIHSEIEERLFYPAVRDVQSDETEDVVNQAVEEHRIISALFEEMSDLEDEDAE